MSGETTGTNRRWTEALPHEPSFPPVFGLIAPVEEAYASLIYSGAPDRGNLLGTGLGESGLGGNLLYVGELDQQATQLVRAANIAGAATLAASHNPAALRKALREGVIDFLVNSLDEALRILKNELRKRQPVAVAVSVEPGTILHQMIERGVLPDLLPPESSAAPPEFANFLTQGTRRIEAPPSPRAATLLIWPIPSEFTQRPADFEVQLLETLPVDDHASRRWLRLSPRYLDGSARRYRSLACGSEGAAKLIARFPNPLRT
jgi:hypothetical protein